MLHNSRFLMITTGALLVGLVGCSTDNLENTAIPVPSVEETELDEITSTLPVQNAADISPASPQFQLPPTDAAPVEVAQKFMEFLNHEDRDSFELLLTPVALNAVTRLQFQLPPIANPATQFKCSPPNYATIRQKMCFVTCAADDTEDSDTYQEISLMLRKTKSGWRVAGMLLKDEETSNSNLLSFESLTDLKQIKSSVQFVGVETGTQ